MRFLSKIPGSTYTFTDGHKVIFAHGFLDVNPENFPGVFNFSNPISHDKHPMNGKPKWEVYAEELNDLVINRNPLIFTQETYKLSEPLPKIEADKNAHSEASVASAETNLRNAAGKNGVTTGDANNGAVVTGGGDVNQNTVDPMLQKVVLGNAHTTGPGADHAAAVRQAAQDRLAARQHQS